MSMLPELATVGQLTLSMYHFQKTIAPKLDIRVVYMCLIDSFLLCAVETSRKKLPSTSFMAKPFFTRRCTTALIARRNRVRTKGNYIAIWIQAELHEPAKYEERVSLCHFSATFALLYNDTWISVVGRTARCKGESNTYTVTRSLVWYFGRSETLARAPLVRPPNWKTDGRGHARL